jgi:hypothetical protein
MKSTAAEEGQRIALTDRLLRGGATSIGCAAALAIVGRAVGVDFRAALMAAWLPGLAIPLAMSLVLSSADPRHVRDFLYGLAWYLFALAVALAFFAWAVVNGWETAAGRELQWIYTFPMLAMMFAFGVLHHHTPLADLMTPGVGVLGGLRQVNHPHKRLLSVVLIAALPTFFLLLAIASRLPNR